MTYRRTGDRITLEMTPDEYDELLMLVGFAAGATRDRAYFWKWIDFANRMNATNPTFTPYEIPKEYQGK